MVSKICDSFYGYYINKNEKYYTVGCVIPINCQFELDEYDRSANAIDLYKSVYNQKDSGICIDETGITKTKVDKGIRRYCYSIDGSSIERSGDIDFNFKFKHIKYFEDILLNVKSPMKNEERENLIQLLWSFYSEMTYSPDNTSIMPRTGALNNIKKLLGDDRLDTLLFALKLYYEEGYTSFVLSAAGGLNSPYVANRNLLKNFLDMFIDNKIRKIV